MIDESVLIAEAEAMRSISRLICQEWAEVKMSEDKTRELLAALYGLDMLIEVHAQHTE